jgi:hypothetical protein
MFKKTFLFSFAVFLLASGAMGQSLAFPEYQLLVENEKMGEKPFLLNRHQTLKITLKPLVKGAKDISDLKFDARMPQHNHGMVTQAQTEKIGPLQFRIKGVRLHMPGDWLLEFTVVTPKGNTRLEVPWFLDSK